MCDLLPQRNQNVDKIEYDCFRQNKRNYRSSKLKYHLFLTVKYIIDFCGFPVKHLQ